MSDLQETGVTAPIIGRATSVTLYLCFFVSGVAGLIYEVLWAKYLALFIGSTGLAQLIVLGTFMGGLALGSYILGGMADRVKSPLKLYAFLEFGIGIYAIAFSQVFILGRVIFVSVVKASGLTAGGLVAAKIISCVICILLPTVLMGGTMPAMSRHIVRSMKAVGPKMARLYFLNSLGAVIGCVCAGFYLIRAYGLATSMIIGGGLNILVGCIALLLDQRKMADEGEVGGDNTKDLAAAVEVKAGARAIIVLLCVGLSGAVSMMYEVSWIRLFSLVLGSSTYSFTIMLATFILGLSIGGFLLSLRKRTGGYALIFGLSEVCVGLTVLLALPMYVRLPYYFNQVASCLSREPQTFGLYQIAKFLLCASVMIVPAILQGITLPAAVKVLTTEIGGFGRKVGAVFAVNTLGTLIGVVFAGCIGLPLLGIKGTLELAIAINAFLGIAILVVSRGRRARTFVLAASVVAILGTWGWYVTHMGDWNREVLMAGVYRSRTRISSYADLQKREKRRKTVFYRDGIDATIAVQDISNPAPHRVLVVNGKVDASTAKDMATQKMIGHLPMLCGEKNERVLVVGIGSGATIGSVLSHDVKEVDVVELARGIIDASEYFEKINGRYWKDQRVKILWEDAKTFLQVTDGKYDVIISQPTNPWIAGIAGVFSKEYFEDCRDRLTTGGLFVQWIQAYELEDSTFFMMLETFTSVFPHYTMWNPHGSDTVLIGSTEKYRPNFERMKKRVSSVAVKDDLKMLGIDSLLPVLWMQMSDHAGNNSHVEWGGVQHSDMFPVLEYVAPRGLFTGARARGARWIDERSWSQANSSIWIVDYLKHDRPEISELRTCYDFFKTYEGFYRGSTLSWALKWAELYDDQRIADIAHAGAGGKSPFTALKDVAARTEKESSLKSACSMAFKGYRSSRSCLVAGEAELLLTEIQKLIQGKRIKEDVDVLRWQGELQYDLALYDDAVISLKKALFILGQTPYSRGEVLNTGMLVCRCLLAAGKPAKASEAFDNYLGFFPDEMRVKLMHALIEAEK